MSLKDTIQGARDELAAQNKPESEAEKKKEQLAEKDPEMKPSGFSKKSVSRAKPARQAASSVTVVSASGKTKKSTANMTKEEQKEERRRQRDAEDRVDSVAQILLENDPNYKPLRRKWWILMGVGFAALILSFVPQIMMQSGVVAEGSTLMGGLSVACMIVAYAGIIASFVFDWRKIRPLRRAHTAAASGMTKKRLQAIMDEDRRKRAAKEAGKRAAKGK